jgi:hypothetical protein
MTGNDKARVPSVVGRWATGRAGELCLAYRLTSRTGANGFALCWSRYGRGH